MGNQESQPLITQYSFYLPETKGYFGQQWDRTMSCSVAYHQRVMRFWSLFPSDKAETFYMKACGLYFTFDLNYNFKVIINIIFYLGNVAEQESNFLLLTKDNNNLVFGRKDDSNAICEWEIIVTGESIPDTDTAFVNAVAIKIKSPIGFYLRHISGAMRITDDISKATTFYKISEELTEQKLGRMQSFSSSIHNGLRKVLWDASEQKDYLKPTVSQEDIDLYENQGYFISRNIIPEEMIEIAKNKIQEGLDKNVDRSSFLGFERQKWNKEYNTCDEMLNLFRNTSVFKNCEQLSGTSIQTPKKCQIALRKPRADGKADFGAADIDWHVDAYSKTTACWFTAVVLIALSDWDKDNMGNFTVYPGSQFKVSEMLKELGEIEFLKAMKNCKPLGINPIQLHVKAGDVIYAHPLLAHDVAPNTSDHIRWAVLFRPPAVQVLSERKRLLDAKPGTH